MFRLFVLVAVLTVAAPSFASSHSFCSASRPAGEIVVEIIDGTVTYRGPWQQAMVFAVSRKRIENSAGSLLHQMKLLAPNESLDLPVGGHTVLVIADPLSGTVIVEGGHPVEMGRAALGENASYPGKAVVLKVLSPPGEIWGLLAVDGSSDDLDGVRNRAVRPDLGELSPETGSRPFTGMGPSDVVVAIDLGTLAVTVVCRAQGAS